MRMRRKPWARPELDASEVYIKNPHDFYENWQAAFDKEQPLCMELGCGKGDSAHGSGSSEPNEHAPADVGGVRRLLGRLVCCGRMLCCGRPGRRAWHGLGRWRFGVIHPRATPRAIP